MAESEKILECRGISREYDAKNRPLKSIDFSAFQGEFIAITGPSGAGKSTLLNILGMLDRADNGTYLVRDVDVNELSDRDRDQFRGRVFGFVFQASHLIAGRTVAQNLDVALQYSTMPSKERPDAIVRALASVGMLHKLNAQVRGLSGGERQRIAIARALAHDPNVLFMDEPTGNLDEENTEIVVRLIEELGRQGITIIVVTHDDRVSARADRQLRLSEGKLAEIRATPAQELVVSDSHRSVARRRVEVRQIFADATFGLLSRPFRAWVAIAIVALGTAGLVVAVGLSSTASRQVDDSIRVASGSTVRATYELEHDRTRDADAAGEDMQKIAELEGVRSVAIRWDVAEIAGSVRRVADQRQEDFRRQVRLVVISGDFFEVTDSRARPGCAAALLVGPGSSSFGTVILGSAAAATLGVSDAGPGQSIWIGSRSLSVIGILEPSRPGFENLDDAILAGSSTGKSVASSIPPGEFVVSTELGMAPELARVIPIALQPANPEWIQVETAAQLGTLRAAVNAQFQQLVSAVAGVLVALAVLVTTAITMAGVNARRTEIALRRAVGARKSEIGILFTLENALSGLLGGFLGVAIGEAVVLGGSALLGWTPVIPISALLFGPVVGVAVSSIAAVMPALKSASIEPSQELHSS